MEIYRQRLILKNRVNGKEDAVKTLWIMQDSVPTAEEYHINFESKSPYDIVLGIYRNNDEIEVNYGMWYAYPDIFPHRKYKRDKKKTRPFDYILKVEYSSIKCPLSLLRILEDFPVDDVLKYISERL